MLYTLPEQAREYIMEQDLPVHVMHMDDEGELPSEDIVVSGVSTSLGEDDEVLFVNSSKPGRHWELPGGRVEPNESVPDAMRRELHEETGHIVTDIHPVLAVLWVFPSKTLVNLVFMADLGPAADAPVDEIQQTGMFSEIPEPVSFGRSGRAAYEYILTHTTWDRDARESRSGRVSEYIQSISDAYDVPVDNRTMSVIAGLALSGVAVAGVAKRAYSHFDSPSDTDESDGAS